VAETNKWGVGRGRKLTGSRKCKTQRRISKYKLSVEKCKILYQ
jgi:hypothetical protein